MLDHMDSVFIFAWTFLRIDTGWRFARLGHLELQYARHTGFEVAAIGRGDPH
jgi:hypothetical protein